MAVSDTNKRHFIVFKLKSSAGVISFYKPLKSFDTDKISSKVGQPYQIVRIFFVVVVTPCNLIYVEFTHQKFTFINLKNTLKFTLKYT